MSAKVATTHRRRGGVYVKSVAPDSLAARCGIEAGDKIYSINGHVLPDGLSYSFHIGMPDPLMVLEKNDGERWELEIENDGETGFGVVLEDDAIMLCRNKCIFCFVDQNPKGYRRSLLIKDEDIRLSFMYGNYSTLSSTDTVEEARIIREKITPLYISVHATDPETRVFMLKNKRSGNILQRLRMFVDNGIQFHAQIVLCPGVNDGPILERSLEDLSALYPGCLSIAVVPLGITAHRQGLTQLTPVSDAFCKETIEFCREFQERFERELGYPMIFLGDELYIRAGLAIPPVESYRDFPQMENGIGMVRRFLDGIREGVRAGPPGWRSLEGRRATLVTGTLFGSVLKECVAELNRLARTNLRVAAIHNDALGRDLINVAGLVHGGDIIGQLRGQELGELIVLPHVMLKDPVDDPILVDDYTPARLASALGVPVVGSGNSAKEMLITLADWRSFVLAWPPSASPAQPAASALF